jgi:hypothetical protein
MHNRRVDVPFAQVARDVLNDRELSLKAKGLYGYLFGKPVEWDFSADRMTKDLKESRPTILEILKELETAGYLYRHKSSTGRMEYHVMFNKTSGECLICEGEPQSKSLTLGLNKPQSKNATVAKCHGGKVLPIIERDSLKRENLKKEILSSSLARAREKNEDDEHVNVVNIQDELVYEDAPPDTYKTKAKIFAQIGATYRPKRRTPKQEAAWSTEMLAKHYVTQGIAILGTELYFDPSEGGKHWKTAHRAIQTHGEAFCRDLVDWYFTSEKGEKLGYDFSSMFTPHSINAFKTRTSKPKTSSVAEIGSQDTKHLFDCFEAVNPSISLMDQNRGEIEACERLLAKWDIESLKNIITRVLPVINADKYSRGKSITPSQLEANLGYIKAFMDQKSKQSKVIEI